MTRPRSARMRLLLARVVVAVGIVLVVVAIVSGRLGFLVVGVIVVGLGAALGPARIRRR
ncbi:hypothetical protein [Agromyces albus]|uniref:hypothetical protein n=1 Tax=Agromyces albus TaxID=205332 RepID=UPI0013E9065E|nr:hypothetical protein [Agromyces albus]